MFGILCGVLWKIFWTSMRVFYGKTFWAFTKISCWRLCEGNLNLYERTIWPFMKKHFSLLWKDYNLLLGDIWKTSWLFVKKLLVLLYEDLRHSIGIDIALLGRISGKYTLWSITSYWCCFKTIDAEKSIYSVILSICSSSSGGEVVWGLYEIVDQYSQLAVTEGILRIPNTNFDIVRLTMWRKSDNYRILEGSIILGEYEDVDLQR